MSARPPAGLVGLLVLALVAAPAATLSLPAPATAPAGPPPSALHAELWAATQACTTASCQAQALQGATDTLAAGLSTTEATPSAWLAQATAIAGWQAPSPAPAPTLPLEQALAELHAHNGHPVTAELAASIGRQVAGLEAPARLALAELVSEVLVAQDEIARATAGTALAELAELADNPRRAMHLVTLAASAPELISPELAVERGALDQALAGLDRPLMAQAAERVLAALPTSTELAGSEVALPLVLVGAEGDTVHTEDRLITIDRSGDDTYLNAAGAGLAGVGLGLTIDEGQGADTYEAAAFAQGAGLAGIGILIDEGGPDAYRLGSFGQGFALAGIGLLHDQGMAPDTYTSPPRLGEPIGTKAASLGGIGLLVDEGGDDAYRQDGLDGFVYGAAGGTGLLADRGGDDTYLSKAREQVLLGESLGNFTGPVQVSSEISGTAVLYDASGDDTYTCGQRVRQGCQAAAGMSSVALLLDESGDDAYWMGTSIAPALVDQGGLAVYNFPMGQGVGYSIGAPTTGPGIGVLADQAGNDTYTAQRAAQGYGVGGIGLLSDEGSGLDTYQTEAPLVGARADGQRWVDGAGMGLGVDEA